MFTRTYAFTLVIINEVGKWPRDRYFFLLPHKLKCQCNCLHDILLLRHCYFLFFIIILRKKNVKTFYLQISSRAILFSIYVFYDIQFPRFRIHSFHSNKVPNYLHNVKNNITVFILIYYSFDNKFYNTGYFINLSSTISKKITFKYNISSKSSQINSSLKY